MVDSLPYSGSALDIAVVYGVVSAGWILLSDQLVAVLIDDPELASTVQTAKGWLFVAGSSVLLFGLVRHGQRSRQQTNERLDRALQQTTVLHRILRHNLRNSCNVIAGNTELVASHVDEDGRGPDPESEEHLEIIREQTEQLVTITEKTRLLRDLVLEEPDEERIDLTTLVSDRVDVARERYPEASFTVTVADSIGNSVTAETDPRLHKALDELLENAVEHSDHDSPSVRVDLNQQPDGTIHLDVADDGPGMPEMERAVLEEGMESPMFHSEGLGLWIARSVVVQADGEISIVENEPRGTVVRITLS
ncbi:hypothetical protein GCM10028857_11500 [Salinarchaeum chitinilyticum]